MDAVGAYPQSKTLAEQAAWDLVDQRGERQKLATICPSAILGPVMPDDDSYSLEGIQRLLDGMPAVPEIGFSWVDVRDVSAAHIAAMEKPEAGGQRFIASGRSSGCSRSRRSCGRSCPSWRRRPRRARPPSSWSGSWRSSIRAPAP